MSTKIQINSLPALMHLLESDGDIAMEIRRSVLKEYEAKHVLPTIAKRIEHIVRTEINDTLFEKKRSYGPKTLKPEHEDAVKLLVGRTADKLIQGIVQAELDKIDFKDRITFAVETRVQDVTFGAVRELVNARIKKALENDDAE